MLKPVVTIAVALALPANAAASDVPLAPPATANHLTLTVVQSAAWQHALRERAETDVDRITVESSKCRVTTWRNGRCFYTVERSGKACKRRVNVWIVKKTHRVKSKAKRLGCHEMLAAVTPSTS